LPLLLWLRCFRRLSELPARSVSPPRHLDLAEVAVGVDGKAYVAADREASVLIRWGDKLLRGSLPTNSARREWTGPRTSRSIRGASRST
jgi:hypothetical protein